MEEGDAGQAEVVQLGLNGFYLFGRARENAGGINANGLWSLPKADLAAGTVCPNLRSGVDLKNFGIDLIWQGYVDGTSSGSVAL